MSKGKKQKRKYLVDAVKGAPSAETTKQPPPPHPMIESIVVRDVATYAHEGVAFDNLQLVNFIYGGNGCGKTTLSRVCLRPSQKTTCLLCISSAINSAR